MPILADIAMMSWPLVVFAFFARLGPARGAVIAFVAGWLALPFKAYDLPGLPDITKMSLTCYAIFAATAIFDMPRLTGFRPRWVDGVALAYCIVPGLSSLANNLGLYDACSTILNATVQWGLPYLLGRLYLADAASLRFAALAMVAGTLVYLPLCWFEIRMSPQLYSMVYGEHYRWGGMRMGGWRPSVFLDSGLQLGLWMTTSTLIAGWLWYRGSWRKTWGLSAGGHLSAIVATTIMCRSTGALVLLVIGLSVLAFTLAFKSRLALVGLLLLCPIYVGVRVAGDWGWQPAVALASLISEERAQSLEFRFENEDILIEKALEQPVFGWGGWGRSRVFDDYGRDISVTDGMWVIELGEHGFVGVALLFGLLLMPLGTLLWRFRARELISAKLAAPLALALGVTLFAVDCLPNAMPNPLYIVVAGGIVSFAWAAHPIREPVTASHITPSINMLPRLLHPGGER